HSIIMVGNGRSAGKWLAGNGWWVTAVLIAVSSWRERPFCWQMVSGKWLVGNGRSRHSIVMAETAVFSFHHEVCNCLKCKTAVSRLA
ncbi:MAG: hypothetical protein GWP17_00600, partial [Aquificales bacterium]|nr:hypothetical protein [Aquificales bacterium]